MKNMAGMKIRFPTGLVMEEESVKKIRMKTRWDSRARRQALSVIQKKPCTRAGKPTTPLVKRQDRRTNRFRPSKYPTPSSHPGPRQKSLLNRPIPTVRTVPGIPLATERKASIPVQPSTGNSESYPGEKEKLVERGVNEGFTIGHKSRTDEESERRIEETAAFLERFFKGNEKEQRFANGLSAPGEEQKSILGMYMGAKRESDNAMQGDWAQSIKDRDKSAFGQGLRDMYHSGMAGGYELGNEAATTLDLLEDARKINNALFLPAPYSLFENQFNGRNYVRDLTGYSGFKLKKYFRDKVKGHLESRSQDNENASLDNPGYLSVKGAGAFLNELPHTLAGAAVASRVKGGTAALVISGVEGGMAAYTKRVDSEMDRLSAKPEGVMLLDPDYVRIKKEVRDPEEARYIMAKEYARQGVLGDIFKGALKGMLGTAITGMTRNGTEGLILKTIQDVLSGMGADSGIDEFSDFINGRNQNNSGR